MAALSPLDLMLQGMGVSRSTAGPTRISGSASTGLNAPPAGTGGKVNIGANGLPAITQGNAPVEPPPPAPIPPGSLQQGYPTLPPWQGSNTLLGGQTLDPNYQTPSGPVEESLYGMLTGAMGPNSYLRSLVGGQIPQAALDQFNRQQNLSDAAVANRFRGARYGSDLMNSLQYNRNQGLQQLLMGSQGNAAGALGALTSAANPLFQSETTRNTNALNLMLQEYARQNGTDPSILALMQLIGSGNSGVGALPPGFNPGAAALTAGTSILGQNLPALADWWSTRGGGPVTQNPGTTDLFNPGAGSWGGAYGGSVGGTAEG